MATATCPLSGRAGIARQAGLTLIELMIAITLGIAIVGVAITLLLSAKSTYTLEDENARLLDTGRFVIESVTRAVRQSAFQNLSNGGNLPLVGQDTTTSSILDHDSRASTPIPGRLANTDVLGLRFFGSSNLVAGVPVADKTVLDCAGNPIPAVQSAANIETGRGSSIYFVKNVPGGEPELHCGFYVNNRFTSLPIASGVEAFRVLYGIDTDGDAVPNRFVDANTLNALDAGKNATNTLWKKIVAVKVSLSLRGARVVRADAATNSYRLFGSDFPASTANGTLVNEATLPTATRFRSRKIFATSIQLRNDAAGGNPGPDPT